MENINSPQRANALASAKQMRDELALSNGYCRKVSLSRKDRHTCNRCIMAGFSSTESFGICVASDITQRMVDGNFSDIPGVLALHDDIIICGKDTVEHGRALK